MSLKHQNTVSLGYQVETYRTDGCTHRLTVVGASGEHERAQDCGNWLNKDFDLHHNHLCPKKGDITSG